jgi:hypothetical protein
LANVGLFFKLKAKRGAGEITKDELRSKTAKVNLLNSFFILHPSSFRLSKRGARQLIITIKVYKPPKDTLGLSSGIYPTRTLYLQLISTQNYIIHTY